MIIVTLECEACGYVYKDKGTNTKHKCPMCKHIEITEKYRDEAEEQQIRVEELEWIKNNRNILEKMEDGCKRQTVVCPKCGFYYFTTDPDQSKCPGCGEWEIHNGMDLTRKGNGSIHCQTCQAVFGPIFCQTCENSIDIKSMVVLEQVKDVVNKRIRKIDIPIPFNGEDVFFEALIGSFKEKSLEETA